ncbi:hypothetical protein MSAN_00305800 [Mycena sanguinolenta]|uniref:Uncharacterized protein n=1 Tax=Mycena sanguinolenta TaxID=230812 RepID=A0A8H7DH80_9AGAR|nr:hypothetical protein MSAN_00305800 [Mycena sanguinolenta]
MPYVSGGRGGSGGDGGVYGGHGGRGEGPSVKISSVTPRTVTNFVTNKCAPTVHSDFRTISLGEIDLQQEIHSNRRSGVASLRKLHSAKILVDGERLNVTVAVYHGAGAQKEWRQDIARYRAIRHTNIVQLYGTASCGNIHAAVFHDELIPLQQIFDLYKHSHLSTVYIYAYRDNEFRVVHDYSQAIFGHYLLGEDCTFFIRRSTGRFCTDLVPGDESVLGYADGLNEASTQRGLRFLSGENPEATIIAALPLNHYHDICRWEFSTRRYILVPPSATVNIGSVLHCPSDDTFDDVVEIAWLPNAALPSYGGWYGSGDWSCFGELMIMADGWTRLKSNHIVDRTMWLSVRAWNYELWLSQANHIFTTLQISSDFEDYVLVEQIYFNLSVSTTEAIPPGFLFLCPPHHFQTEECSFKWPDCPAYWSLDPSGTERLTSEEATNLGFPSFSLSTRVMGVSWDASVYAGLRQFHKGKGFDPDSQDVAQHLGHELYQLSGQNRTDTLFAHIEEECSDNADNRGSTSGHPTKEAPNHDLASPSPRQNVVEEPVSNVVEQIVDSTHTDYVDLPIAFAHQDAEEMPVSSPFKLVLNMQLSLIFLSVFSWVLSDM